MEEIDTRSLIQKALNPKVGDVWHRTSSVSGAPQLGEGCTLVEVKCFVNKKPSVRYKSLSGSIWASPLSTLLTKRSPWASRDHHRVRKVGVVALILKNHGLLPEVYKSIVRSRI